MAEDLVGVQRELFARYEKGDYRGALALVEDRAARLDLLWTRVAWWRACLLAKLGRIDQALDVLEAALDAGAWWSPSTLRREPDFSALVDHPRFRRLVEECSRRRDAYRPGLPGLYVSPGDGAGVVVALHGRAEIVEATVGYWEPPVRRAGWELMVPESTQRDSVDGPCWDDPIGARRQIEAQLARVRHRRRVIGGYSQGGRRAIQLGLASGRFELVVAVSPALIRPGDIAEVLGSVGDGPQPRIVVWTGDGDPALPGQEMVVEALRSEGIDVELEVLPGVGHYYPPDFGSRLTRLLERSGRSSH